MDISNGKAFLTTGEQKKAGLQSPIELDGFPIAERLAETQEEVQRLDGIVFSDPEDYLPNEKGEARPALSQALSRLQLYTALANRMMLEGTVDISEVIDNI